MSWNQLDSVGAFKRVELGVAAMGKRGNAIVRGPLSAGLFLDNVVYNLDNVLNRDGGLVVLQGNVIDTVGRAGMEHLLINLRKKNKKGKEVSQIWKHCKILLLKS